MVKELDNCNTELEINKKIAKSLNDLWEQENKKREQENNPLTYEEIARFVGITPQAFKSYLKGNKSPKSNKIPKLKEFFSTSYERIFGETESDDKRNITIRKDLGLSDKAIENLVKLNKLSHNKEMWGEDEQEPLAPNMYLFAINKLLENDKILFLIGDYLSNPSIDNEHLDIEIKELLQNEQIYIPNDDYYSFKIMKLLEELHNEIGKSQEVSSFAYDKLKVAKYNAKDREKQYEYFSKINDSIPNKE